MAISQINSSSMNTGAGAPSWDSSGNLSFNSGYGSSVTAYGCRAWVNFNGTGTVAILASGNVSSITDMSVGEYQINFSTAMPDSNYNTVGTIGGGSGIFTSTRGGGKTTGRDQIFCINTSGSGTDFDFIYAAIFR